MSTARQEFDRLYGHLNLSGEDAAWHVFKSGWDAREQTAPAQPLTDEQITLVMMQVEEQGRGYFLRLARAIEAAHGITKGGTP